MTRLPLAAVTALLALVAAAPAGAAAPQARERPLRDVDVRKADGGPLPATQRRGRASLEDSLGDEGVVSTDRVSGGARLVARRDGFLTGRRSGPPADVALDYVRERPEVFGLDATDLDALRLQSRYRSEDGVTHLAYTQTYRGIAAYDNVLIANVEDDGRLVNVGGAAVPGLRVPSVTPGLDAGAALAAARREVGGSLVPPRVRQARGPERATRFSNGDRAQLTIFSDGRSDRLAWRIVLTGEHGFLYEIVVDAASGDVLKRRSLTEFAVPASVYDFYPGAPSGGTPRTVDLAEQPGWLTSTTILSGNNAHAYADIGATDGAPTIAEIAPSSPGPVPSWVFPQLPVPTAPPCPASGCTWDPSTPGSRTTNRSQATTQLFYLVNTYHDHLAAAPIGFTHAARGFEVVDADGAGPGVGGDPVLAESDNLDEGAAPPNINNSSMSTPPDGQSPKLQVLFFTNPSLNAADAADVVYHEYTHGLTSRSIGTGIGLTANQSRAMGEAWSDWYALDFLANQGHIPDTAAPDEVRIGTYLVPGGFRRQGADCPVGSSCPGTPGTGSGGFTLGDLGHFSAGFSVHDNGEIWLETLWDIRGALGSATAEGLITSGLRLLPNNPSYLEARDGIIQADQAAGGANYTTLWQLFAARGMGFSARTSADATIAAEAFDMPPVLQHASAAVADPAPGGDGDGIAEPGETVRLVESLRNATPFGVSGVSGVLRATTPGVVAIDPSSTWPSFGANTVRSADAPLAVAIPSSLPCGKRAQMNLRVATGQGKTTIPLEIPTGRLGATMSSTDVPRAIPNNPAEGISTLTFPPSSATAHDLKVRIGNLTHGFVGDLRITLESPTGTRVMLMNSPGAGDFGASGRDFADLVLDDDAVTPVASLPDPNPGGGAYAGSYRPDEPLSAFEGTPLQGTWKLYVTDLYAAADSGTLNGWGLIPAGQECATPPNGQPVGVPDAFSVTAGTTLSGPSVLANDSDPESTPLRAIELSEPAHGALALGADGLVTYTPAAGFTGTDSFTYAAYDGRATSPETAGSIVVGAATQPSSSPSPPPPPPPPQAAAHRASAKLQVLRAGVSGGRLDVLAAITARATGKVRVRYRSAGATTAFDAAVSRGRIRFRKALPSTQRATPSGIVTLAYSGSALVEPDGVTLRAARGRARLVRSTSRIDARGMLHVAGTITPRARGVVRVRLAYVPAGGGPTSVDYRAKIARGRWSLNQQLPAAAAAAGGQLSIQFTGYEPLGIRGEQVAKEVGAGG